MRTSSSTYRNRLSKTFSVAMLVPSAVTSIAMSSGWKSVARPGYGSVTKSSPRARSSWRTRTPSSVRSIRAPASDSFDSASSRWSARAPTSSTSPRVATAAIANVPASIRSGIVAWSAGSKPSTPSISIVLEPAPRIRAPMETRNVARSAISGSRAALSITVVPLAPTAAISRFSVAPTLGYSSVIEAPRSRGARAWRKPCSIPISAPMRSSPFRWRSIGREPMLSPPGIATRASPRLASSGPRTTIEARICRTSSYGASTDVTSEPSIVTRSPFQLTPRPMCSRSSPIRRQSRILGTREIVQRPGASSAPAMSLSAEFLAPEIGTDPARRAPPVTRSRSMAVIVVPEPRDPRRFPRSGPVPRAQIHAGGGLEVDLLLELGIHGHHVHARALGPRAHMQEAAVHDGPDLPPRGLLLDPQRADRELDQQRGVAREDADLARHAARDHHLRRARPDLTLRRDDVDVDRHAYAASMLLACATASSMPPTSRKACSGRWSYSPSVSPLNDAIVSSTGTYFPGIFVICFDTANCSLKNL